MNQKGKMKTKVLSRWIAAETKKYKSINQFALSLGVTRPALIKWLNEECSSLSSGSVNALAKYRDEDISGTYKWLGIKQVLSPKKRTDHFQEQIDELKAEIEDLRNLLAA